MENIIRILYKVFLLVYLYTVIIPVMAKHIVYDGSSGYHDDIGQQNLDIVYSGDVVNLPRQLRQYDPHLIIYPPLGQYKYLPINLNLEHVTLNDINDAIMNQSNNQVKLIYDMRHHNLRLQFIYKMDVGRDAVEESLKWQHGTTPLPVLQADGVVRFPFGQYQPILTCKPLNLCDIELQAGEEIQGVVIGDSAHWNEGDTGIPIVYSGMSNTLTPHLVLKPDQGGLETTLIITTSKRTYMIKLKSSVSGYVVRMGFYYPQELLQQLMQHHSQSAKVSERKVDMPSAVQTQLIDLAKLNYQYTISGKDYVWRPTQVFDDGVSVYIHMPTDVDARSLPSLCVLPDGDMVGKRCELVNFRYKQHFYIIDKLFNQAKLINGFSTNSEIITTKHTPYQPSWWSKVFGKA